MKREERNRTGKYELRANDCTVARIGEIFSIYDYELAPNIIFPIWISYCKDIHNSFRVDVTTRSDEELFVLIWLYMKGILINAEQEEEIILLVKTLVKGILDNKPLGGK